MRAKKDLSGLMFNFWLDKRRANEEGECPIFVRLRINNTTTTFSIKREVHPRNWGNKNQIVGNSLKLNELRQYITRIHGMYYQIAEELMEIYPKVTARMIRNVFEGKAVSEAAPVEVQKADKVHFILAFDDFLQKQILLEGTCLTQKTIERYKYVKEVFIEFVDGFKTLKSQGIHSKNLKLTDISKGLLLDFRAYLLTEKGNGYNTANKQLQRFKRFINHCIDYKFLEETPFKNFRLDQKTVNREYLTWDEVNLLINKEFTTNRLSQVRDVFVFQCFTGLAYIDAQKLVRSEIHSMPDGSYCIYTDRIKTNERSSIPLLPIPLGILRKYADLDKVQSDHKMLPVCSNDKMNEYLAEIASLCGIRKTITTHIARHTFATLALSFGLPKEILQSVLGHRSIKTTEIYAKMIDTRVNSSMAKLGQAFALNNDIKSL